MLLEENPLEKKNKAEGSTESGDRVRSRIRTAAADTVHAVPENTCYSTLSTAHRILRMPLMHRKHAFLLVAVTRTSCAAQCISLSKRSSVALYRRQQPKETAATQAGQH